MQCLFNVLSDCTKWSSERPVFNCSAITLGKGASGSEVFGITQTWDTAIVLFHSRCQETLSEGPHPGETQSVCSPCAVGGWRLGQAERAQAPPHTWSPRCTPSHPQPCCPRALQGPGSVSLQPFAKVPNTDQRRKQGVKAAAAPHSLWPYARQHQHQRFAGCPHRLGGKHPLMETVISNYRNHRRASQGLSSADECHHACSSGRGRTCLCSGQKPQACPQLTWLLTFKVRNVHKST